MRIHLGTVLLWAIAAAGPLPAQQQLSPEEAEARAQALATRRAERDAARAERLPSRPFVLREPLPLPVDPVRPPGGEAAGKACAVGETCTVDFAVPPGRVLVVTALWSATEARCDGDATGASPGNGDAIAPWWHCARSLRLTGKGAGFAGYLVTAAEPAKTAAGEN